MKKVFFFFILSVSFLAACKQDSKTSGAGQNESPHASAKQLDGFWIAMDFCAKANQYGSVLQSMNNGHVPYAYALAFNPAKPDSVVCYNGLETWTLPVKYNVDTLELVGARQGKSVFLVFNSQAQGDRDMTMFDVTTGTALMDRFIKSRAGTKDCGAAFIVAINHNVLGGLFTSSSKGVTGDVQFTVSGDIKGLKDYDRFELCIAGDCFVAGDAIDVVTFSNSKKENSEKMFGYRFDGQNDALTFYNLINKNPEEKGAYVVGNEVYKLVRRKPAK